MLRCSVASKSLMCFKTIESSLCCKVCDFALSLLYRWSMRIHNSKTPVWCWQIFCARLSLTKHMLSYLAGHYLWCIAFQKWCLKTSRLARFRNPGEHASEWLVSSYASISVATTPCSIRGRGKTAMQLKSLKVADHRKQREHVCDPVEAREATRIFFMLWD